MSAETLLRDKVTIENRLFCISKLYMKGMNLCEIAETVNVSHDILTEDLALIRAEWRKQYSESFDQRLDRELAKIDNIERIAWEEYEESKKGSTTTTMRREKGVRFMRPDPSTNVKGSSKIGNGSSNKVVKDDVTKEMKIVPNDEMKPTPIMESKLIPIKEVDEVITKLSGGNIKWIEKVCWAVETRLKLMGAFQDTQVNNNNLIINWQDLSQKVVMIDPIEERLRREEENAIPILPTAITTAPLEIKRIEDKTE